MSKTKQNQPQSSGPVLSSNYLLIQGSSKTVSTRLEKSVTHNHKSIKYMPNITLASDAEVTSRVEENH